MRTENHVMNKNGRRTGNFPELYVGFPERNDASEPYETERIHVDLDTLSISRKSESEVTRAILGRGPYLNKK